MIMESLKQPFDLVQLRYREGTAGVQDRVGNLASELNAPLALQEIDP
jgi:hypothetical protein